MRKMEKSREHDLDFIHSKKYRDEAFMAGIREMRRNERVNKNKNKKR